MVHQAGAPLAKYARSLSELGEGEREREVMDVHAAIHCYSNQGGAL